MSEEKKKEEKKKHKLDVGTRTLIFLLTVALTFWVFHHGPYAVAAIALFGWLYILYPYFKN